MCVCESNIVCCESSTSTHAGTVNWLWLLNSNSLFGNGEWKWREKKGKEGKRMEELSILLFGCTREKKNKWGEMILFCGAHYFGINLIWAEIEGRENTNFIRPTTLYYKMNNMFLILSRNYECSNVLISLLLIKA